MQSDQAQADVACSASVADSQGVTIDSTSVRFYTNATVYTPIPIAPNITVGGKRALKLARAPLQQSRGRDLWRADPQTHAIL